MEKDFSTLTKRELINEARLILRGSRNLNSTELENLCNALESQDQFAYATEILLVKMDEDELSGNQTTLSEFQRLARFIYKDHSLPSSFKFDKALHELTNHENLKTTTNCETLGLVGAIYKRKWIFDNQFRNLILSRYYYKLGYEIWKTNKDKGDIPQNDNGYCAINFAFMSELMSVVKLKEHGSQTGVSDSILSRLNEAEATRQFIIAHFKQAANTVANTWILPTLIEAYLATGAYAEAAFKMTAYLTATEPLVWQNRSLIKQLLAISDLKRSLLEFAANNKVQGDEHFINLPDTVTSKINITAIEKLTELLVDKAESDEDISIGKIGLALSGGGFRASFFQIGVLAALAECNVLKKVEVLSCVSGGSILGAYYYIKLKTLLDSVSDETIKQEQYLDLVREMEKDFLNAVQKNLRMRIFDNPFKNLKIIAPQWLDFKWMSKDIKSISWLYPNKYSRTHRLGELYEKYLYAPLQTTTAQRTAPIYINGLYVMPPGAKEFNPAVDNWKRENKVPQLILNSTSMNTGHNWQFTASWMGEPPGNIFPDIDAKQRLRRMYYEEAPGKYKNFRLGHAVAASSCVPVMFEALPMNDLYPDIKLQLIDGGVHDNQGIAALIDEECKNMIIADGSGQMPVNPETTKGVIANFYRSDTILQERLRELQFLDIKSHNYTSLVKNLLIVHLKSDLHKPPYNWKYCEDPARTVIDSNRVKENKDLTSYNILVNVQQLLSEVRTDLDAFTEVEASALMYSGYLQTKKNIKQTELFDDETSKEGCWNFRTKSFDDKAYSEDSWNFLRLDDFLTEKTKAEFICKHLKYSNKLAFKFLQVMYLKILFFILIISLGGFGIYLLVKNYDVFMQSGIPAKTILVFIAMAILGFVSSWLKRIINYKSEIRQWLIKAGLISGMAVVSNVYLKLINKAYLNAGSIAGIKKKYEKEMKRLQKKGE